MKTLSTGLGKVPRTVAALCLTALLSTGCRSIQVQEERRCATGIGSGEAIAVILNAPEALTRGEARAAEERLARCINQRVARKHPQCRVLTPDQFRGAVFPGLDFDAAPHTPESLAILLDHPVFRERVRALGLRYLVLVGGKTTSVRKWGDIACGGGYGGGGCLGLIVFDQTSRYAALVLDLASAGQAGEVKVAVSGRPWVTILAILPLGLPAFTEGRACAELGEGVAAFLGGGGSVPKAQPGQEEREK